MSCPGFGFNEKAGLVELKYLVGERIKTQENVRLSNYLDRRSLSREVRLIPLPLLLILA